MIPNSQVGQSRKVYTLYVVEVGLRPRLYMTTIYSAALAAQVQGPAFKEPVVHGLQPKHLRSEAPQLLHV